MRLLVCFFCLLLAEGGLSFSGLCSARVKNVPVRTGWRGLAQGPTCNQPFRAGNLLDARPCSVPPPCRSARRAALICLLHSGLVSDGGAEERDQASGQLEAAEGKMNAGKEELKTAGGKLKTAEGKLDVAKEDLKTAEGKLEAAERKLEAADPQQKALAQKACDRAEKAYELAVKNVNRAGRAVDIALDALQRTGAGSAPQGVQRTAIELTSSVDARRSFRIDQNDALEQYIRRAGKLDFEQLDGAIVQLKRGDGKFGFLLGSSGIGKTQAGIGLAFRREQADRVYYTTARDCSQAQPIYNPFSQIAVLLEEAARLDMEAAFRSKQVLSTEDKREALSVASLGSRSLFLFGWIDQMVRADPWTNMGTVFPFELKSMTWGELAGARADSPTFFIDEVSSQDEFMAQVIRNAFRAAAVGVFLAGTSASAANILGAARATGYARQQWCFLVVPGASEAKVADVDEELDPLVRRCLMRSRPLFSLAAKEALQDQPPRSLSETLEDMCVRVFEAANLRKQMFRNEGGRHGQLCMLISAYHQEFDVDGRASLSILEVQGSSLVNSHFAQPSTRGYVSQWLSVEGNELLFSDGSAFTTDCYFPSAEDDLLLHLALPGGRTHSALQAPNSPPGLAADSRVPFVSYFLDVRRADGTEIRNPAAAIVSGQGLELVLAAVFCLASRQNGFQGVSVAEWLTGIASELKDGKQFRQYTLNGPEAILQRMRHNTMPFLSPPNQPWPQEVMVCAEISFGNVMRVKNLERVDCLLAGGTVACCGEAKDTLLTSLDVVSICKKLKAGFGLCVVLVRELQTRYFTGEETLQNKLGKQWKNVENSAFFRAVPVGGVLTLTPIEGLPCPADPEGVIVFFDLFTFINVRRKTGLAWTKGGGGRAEEAGRRRQGGGGSKARRRQRGGGK